MGKRENLMPVEELNSRMSPEEHRQNSSKGGKKSAEARQRRKTMRELASMMMNMQVRNLEVKEVLENLGLEEDDLTYQSAVVAKLIQNAVEDGDTPSVRILGELTGELGKGSVDEGEDIVEMRYPSISLPDNGRDRKPRPDVIAPQAGPQTMFMASSADIVIYGGAAGGGKTYALLLEGLRHKDVPGFGAVILRKEYTQITNEGGLWDASHKIYDLVPDAVSSKSPKLHWTFQSGAKINFSQLTRDEDLGSWQGSQICYLAFDELTHFTKKQFLYMFSRNRSTCGIRPYIRCTCNPDADSWVASFISWWIDQETGYPIPERSGVVRYMCLMNEEFHFASSPQELEKLYGVTEDECKSVTFISSKLTDNKILMESDPAYMANLKALLEVDRERLLNGNWKIKPAAGSYFKRSQVGILEELPNDIVSWARGWDLAATSEDENGDPAYTASVLIGKRRHGKYVVVDVTNQRLSAAEVREAIMKTCAIDKAARKHVVQRLPQDPGQAGKAQKESFIKMLAGYSAKMIPESGSKETRAEPFATQWQAGNVDLMLGEWNEMYLSELESFPESKFKDMVDASSSAFSEIESGFAASPPPDSVLNNKRASYWKKR